MTLVNADQQIIALVANMLMLMWGGAVCGQHARGAAKEADSAEEDCRCSGEEKSARRGQGKLCSGRLRMILNETRHVTRQQRRRLLQKRRDIGELATDGELALAAQRFCGDEGSGETRMLRIVALF